MVGYEYELEIQIGVFENNIARNHGEIERLGNPRGVPNPDTDI